MKKILWTAGAILLVGGVWVWAADGRARAASNDESSTESTFTVNRGELVVTLKENGTLVAKESKRIKPEGSRGEAKITWLIEEGTTVEEGTVVAKLDTEKLVEEIEQKELELTQAETTLASDRSELEIQQTENLTSKEKVEMDLDRARKDLERYRDGDAKQERRGLTIKIKDMETALSRAKKRLDDSRLLVEQEYIKRTELEDHELEHEKAVVQRDGALLDLELFDRYTYPMTLADKEAAVRKAERDVDTEAKRSKSKLAQRQNAVAQAEKRVKKIQKALEERRERLGQMELKAPVPGIVFYGDPSEPWRRDEIRIGASVWRGHTIVTIPDLRVMQVNVKVHEADINKVKKGQRVHITMDTYPGKVIVGEVTKVAQIAGTRDRWGDNTAVKVFDVETTISEMAEIKPKPGISAKVEIFIDKKPDVMQIPLQSVGIDGEQQYCHVVGPNGEHARRDIEVGIANEHYIEVLSGLEIGEQVLLYNPMLPTGAGEDTDEGDAEPPATEGADTAEGEG